MGVVRRLLRLAWCCLSYAAEQAWHRVVGV